MARPKLTLDMTVSPGVTLTYLRVENTILREQQLQAFDQGGGVYKGDIEFDAITREFAISISVVGTPTRIATFNFYCPKDNKKKVYTTDKIIPVSSGGGAMAAGRGRFTDPAATYPC